MREANEGNGEVEAALTALRLTKRPQVLGGGAAPTMLLEVAHESFSATWLRGDEPQKLAEQKASYFEQANKVPGLTDAMHRNAVEQIARAIMIQTALAERD